MRWRVIITKNLSPALNMAIDEALLDCCSEPTLRFYSWRPAAVSVGYFQEVVESELNGYPFVRRITGGGAIIHDGDLTYSAVIAESLMSRDGAYELLHRVFVRALQTLGVPARIRDAVESPTGRSGFFCSERPARLDVVGGKGKLLGSAMRRRNGTLLQHGSLTLKPIPHDPRAGSVQQELGRAVGFDEMVGLLLNSLRRSATCDYQTTQLPPNILEHARTLAEEKYSRREWNWRLPRS